MDIEELSRAVEAMTPVPWRCCEFGGDNPYFQILQGSWDIADGRPTIGHNRFSNRDHEQERANGTGIALLRNSAPSLLSELSSLRREVERLRAELAGAADTARGHEPVNGWGTPSTINEAWADGFRVACVEISDRLRAAIFPSVGGETGEGKTG